MGRAIALCGALCVLVAMVGRTADRRILLGHMPEALGRLRALGRLPAETNLSLAIGLPLRNTEAMTNLMRDVTDPSSPRFRHYLKPAQFTEQFGPTEADYQKVIQFAQAHGLRVKRTHPNRVLVDVIGPVANIEEAFQVHLQRYQHPSENREFYAPDAEPSVDIGVPILHVSGLDNYILPHPMDMRRATPIAATNSAPISFGTTGSGPGGSYTGRDFRPCYVPGVTNTGTGQTIALIEFGQYYTNDIYKYRTNAGIPPVNISNVLIDVPSAYPTGAGYDDGEEALDIDMSMAIAPGAAIVVYEGGPSDDLMNQIATDDVANQISLSWGFGIDETTIQIFQQYLLQGQSFAQASGDGGADAPGGGGLTGIPYTTICGGTALTTSGPGGAWKSESSWIGSGGGVSSYGIPPWQEGISMTANEGSTINRNFPDVAMLADTVIFWYLADGSSGEVGGTSASTPEWTAVMALVNQSAAAQGLPPIGFVNPALYQIGKGGGALAYAKCFHDIVSGNNFSSAMPTNYPAKPGYDLCTGWGSPIGTNLIAALLAIGTNDFELLASQVGFNIVHGGTATTLVSVTPMNEQSGSATFSISGLPNGVTASFGPVSDGVSSILTINTTAAAMPGTSSPVITATSGGLTHTLALSLTITEQVPGAVQVNLASYFNRVGIYTDGTTFSGSGGLDGGGYAYSATLLGSAPSVNNVLFKLGNANANDVISTSGQVITLPQGQYTTLQMLATAVDGNQANQRFTITYTDGSTTVISQSLSDWFTPANYAGETIISGMPYRNTSGGTEDQSSFNLYDYSFTLNQTKTVKSITLPVNANIKVLAMTLVNAPVSASLAGLYNRAGIYSDGVAFTNPPTGGLDGLGSAYSGNLLGLSQTINGVEFSIPAPNVTNVTACAGQTITLPAGNYYALRMLATAYNGATPTQPFTVTYTDSSTKQYFQSLSDWFTPGSYAGETKAVPMGYRNLSTGKKDNRTFYLYGYSFPLDSTKVTQSLQLPNNSHVVVVAVSLVPNYQPAFINSPFAEPAAQAGQPYSATIATNAFDLNAGDTLTYALVSGPAWLGVAANGALSGTPQATDAGTNSFVVSVTDAGGLSGEATLNINVAAALSQPISAGFGLAPQGTTNFTLTWTGGTPPYHVEMTTNLASGVWTDITGPIETNSLTIIPTNGAAFYQITGQ